MQKASSVIFLLVNAIFIWKYGSRTAYSPVIGIVAWLLLASAVCWIAQRVVNNEKRAKWATAVLLSACTLVIVAALIKINPLSVNVDRWSATSYFLDGLFRGEYPYGIHTHVCETNYPSPFPLWHYLNLPFWLLGDVGLGLFFFLMLFIFSVRWFTRSWMPAFFVLLLLALSPAYWWEVAVRSDGLSNSFVIFSLILWMERRQISFQRHFVLTAIACGLAAVTRLSAIIPMAIYCAKSFLTTTLKRQITSLLIIITVVFLFFAPYIFWNTETWVFFNRNPLMSQTSTGSPIVLILMMCLALWLALRYNRDFIRYASSTAIFLFLFFAAALINVHIAGSPDISWMEDADFDISYLTLSFPYCLFAMAAKKEQHDQDE